MYARDSVLISDHLSGHSDELVQNMYLLYWPELVQNISLCTNSPVQTMVEIYHDFDGLVQERCNSSALAMELRLSCTSPLIYSLLHILQAKIVCINTNTWRYRTVHNYLSYSNAHVHYWTWVIISWGYDLSPIWCQAITWNNLDLLSIGSLRKKNVKFGGKWCKFHSRKCIKMSWDVIWINVMVHFYHASLFSCCKYHKVTNRRHFRIRNVCHSRQIY